MDTNKGKQPRNKQKCHILQGSHYINPDYMSDHDKLKNDDGY